MTETLLGVSPPSSKSTPFNSSHFSLTPEERRAARIDDGMIRVSCGVEPSELLVGDFLRALDATA
jgi:cystathionine beta-lyase/cystathionine gamma-synthase